MERTGAHILRHIVRSTLEQVAHRVLHLGKRNFPVGNNVQGHRHVAVGVDPRKVFVGIFVEAAEIAPYAAVAAATRSGVMFAVSIGKAEFLILTVEITALAGEGDNIL